MEEKRGPSAAWDDRFAGAKRKEKASSHSVRNDSRVGFGNCGLVGFGMTVGLAVGCRLGGGSANSKIGRDG